MQVKILFASIFAGMILGAPIGAAGALVADSAFSHSKKRLESTITAAVLGDTLLASLCILLAQQIKLFLDKYCSMCFLAAGSVFIIMGIHIAFITFRTGRGHVSEKDISTSLKWVLGHAAPVIGVFLITVIHPGNIAAFLALTALFSSLFPELLKYKLCFVSGIASGSLMIFTFAGLIFWKVRKKADRFIKYFRYTLAVILAIIGVYSTFSVFR